MTWISATPLQDERRVLLSTSPDFPRASLRFEFGKRRDLIAHRLSLNGDTIALIRLDDWWDWLWVGFGEFPEIFGHLRATNVEAVTSDPAAFVRVEMLDKPHIFGRGDFIVEPLRLFTEREDGRRAVFVEPDAVTNQPWAEFQTCGVIPSRPASTPDSGRVKWYRKLAREGQLPPVFLYYHVGLISWVIVDGHDRLQAARLENITPKFMGISSVRHHKSTASDEFREELEAILAKQLERSPTPKMIDGINRRLIALYQDDNWRAITSGTALAGGIDDWSAETRKLSLPSDTFLTPH